MLVFLTILFSFSSALAGMSLYLLFRENPKQLYSYVPIALREVFLLRLEQLGYKLSVEIYFRRFLIALFLGMLLTVLTSFPLNMLPILLALLVMILMYQRWFSRQEQVSQELADFSQSVSLAVSAGQDFSAALSFYVSKSKGLLVDECHEVLRRLRLGQTREAAFSPMVGKYPLTREFVMALNLSEKQGTPLSSVLQSQADRWRQQHWDRAEAHSQRLPILLMGPLALCIFPNVFIALLGPFLLGL